jgi:hypothetical protein
MKKRTRIVPRHMTFSDTVFSDPVFWVLFIVVLAAFLVGTWIGAITK